MRNLKPTTTLIEAVRTSLAQAGRHNPSDMVAPAAILWADPEAQWVTLVEQLRSLMPELLTLGDYSPQKRVGPAIWLRCAIERTLDEVDLAEDSIPIIYLPNVSRQTLRAGDACPENLQPLVELQYRGAVWTQRNGRDWTVEAFLVSEDGLGLDVARDHRTREAMIGSLEQLAATPISRLSGKRLEAEDFDKLMIGDPPRELLQWLSDPREMRQHWDGAKWSAFCSRCKADYGFDPESEGELVAAEKLGRQQDDVWKALWQRFKEAPGLYPGIAGLLRRAKPSGEIMFDKEPWPDENELEENTLRKALLDFETLDAAAARTKIFELEKVHGSRREWVWSQLGESPLAECLKHLSLLAEKTTTKPGGDKLDAMAEQYVDDGYKADLAVLKALSALKSNEDLKAVKSAVQTLYTDWLDDGARHLQNLIGKQTLRVKDGKERYSDKLESHECLLFVDGLRFDVAKLLQSQAEGLQLQVTICHRWAALPSVTGTAKPAVSPVHDLITGDELGEVFAPAIKEDSQLLNTARFRKLLAENGFQVIPTNETGAPGVQGGRGWTEFGEFDRLGHDWGIKLATRIEEQNQHILERIQELLNAGWVKVCVITDHGWLLLPDGLPDVKLPKYLVKSRWARCAAIKDSSHIDVPTAPWYWNEQAFFAYAPGISCFGKGNEFAHGGVSLQECLIPEMTFELTTAARSIDAKITEIQWAGMRCRIKTEITEQLLIADIRSRPNDSSSSLTTPKKTDSQGNVSLLVADDSLEGTVVSVVLLDSSGRALTKQLTTIGGEE